MSVLRCVESATLAHDANIWQSWRVGVGVAGFGSPQSCISPVVGPLSAIAVVTMSGQSEKPAVSIAIARLAAAISERNFRRGRRVIGGSRMNTAGT